ncbi:MULTISPECIES: hypothetical protein [Pseudomonas]|jgi:hypothetical protein|uniref:Uncharacterized protein n=1 Tax=Pseudomonas putida TaxID=303 RepID=A0A8I1EPD7_PSEPU|nr:MULTISPECIES: hypothetical protein [Pseudomonas]AVD93852.1 hypothetical protein C4Q27_16245 [Pseudomonas sp. SWI36]MBI6888754.1 hypothetical protein [Pseudomonas putida]OAS13148.1 hypothetical protein AYO08_01325 [Pseudomonas putida]
MSVTTEQVHAHLKTALKLDPDAVHVTEVADMIGLDVIRSRTLLEESLHWLKQNQEPTYDQGLFGLFDKPSTFDPAHRVAGLRLPDLEREIGRMLGRLG